MKPFKLVDDHYLVDIADAGALRRLAETALRSRAATPPDAMGSPDLQQLLQDLQLHQVELEMQNEELRRVQQELEVSKAGYVELYDQAPVGYCLIDSQGLVRQANLTLSTMLGLTCNDLLHRSLTPCFDPQDQDSFYLLCRQLQQDRQATKSGEFRLRKADGSQIWVQLTASDAAGAGLRVVLSEIHRLKVTEQKLRLSEDFNQAVMNSVGEHIAVLDPQGLVLAVNGAWKRFVQASQAPSALTDPVGLNYLAIFTQLHGEPNQKEALLTQEGIRAVLSGAQQEFQVDYPSHTAKEPRWFRIHATPMRGEQRGAVISHTNITLTKQSEMELRSGRKALREAAQHKQAILDNLVDGFITVDTQGRIESFNHAASAIFGYTQDDVLGRDVSLLMADSQRHREEFIPSRVGQTGSPREVTGLRRDGSRFPMRLAVSRLAVNGRITFLSLVRDITLERQQLEDIHRLAFYDPLTNLPNRRLLLDRLKQAMTTAKRTKAHGALMFLDLDHFKRLNDSLGHAMGDMLLQQVAQRLSACVGVDDSVSRLGGDEFVILIESISPHVQDAATHADRIARKIVLALGEPYGLKEHRLSSTPSIGIVLFMDGDDSVHDLLKKADLTMYQAKNAGRNRALFYDPAMLTALDALVELEDDLVEAMLAQQFVLHYQVQVDGHGKVTGAEALVRWQHPRRGLMLPGEFIPVAENMGLILALGKWVMEAACEQLVAWGQMPEREDWTLSVNVSAAQFAQADFVAQVVGALQKTGANPFLLKLELTESMLVKEIEDVIAKMTAIKAHGVSFSLDDFGTGYSSLSHLKRLPLDQIKIDQSFVRDVLTDPSDAVIARTILKLGMSLGLKVIAEGVETAGQRAYLSAIGCQAFQGYYFGRPVPADELDPALPATVELQGRLFQPTIWPSTT